MDQENRRFSPETLVIQAGSKVSFPNLDPIFHNVFSLSSPKTFDLGNYPKGDTRIVTFPEPGIVYVSSVICIPTHGRDHRDAPPTNGIPERIAMGCSALTNVPPGKYTIVAWHKAAGVTSERR